jgi:hypothetical protein
MILGAGKLITLRCECGGEGKLLVVIIMILGAGKPITLRCLCGRGKN